MTRRSLLASSVGLAAGAAISVPFLAPKYYKVRRHARSRIAIVRADEYSDRIDGALMSALRLFDLNVGGKSVLLKPNLVDFVPGVDINTHPVLVSAAADCFRRLGARSVTVAEGPGHQRDTQLVLSESGYRDELAQHRIPFVDLKCDELVKIKLRANYTGLGHLWLPRTVLSHDLVVSMPKVKTHHWSGVTLSMKNMFGVVPGSKYGWPKNTLHWRGIQQSILDICATVPIHFVIADAIVAMEGNGPLAGTSRPLHSIVLSDELQYQEFESEFLILTSARLRAVRPFWIDTARLARGNDDGRKALQGKVSSRRHPLGYWQT
jgi:uncharacterized protein (DUF362 family)